MLEELGNVGELIAAIATVATLAYLALQIRENSKSVQGSTVQAHLHLEVAVSALITQNANSFLRGCANLSDLNDEEGIVFQKLVEAEMTVLDNAFFQYQNGLIPSYDIFLADWEKYYMKKSGFQSVWAEIRHAYPVDFCECLDGVSKAGDGAA